MICLYLCMIFIKSCLIILFNEIVLCGNTIYCDYSIILNKYKTLMLRFLIFSLKRNVIYSSYFEFDESI